MKQIKKIVVVSLIMIIIVFNFPKASFSAETVRSSTDNITTHLPESVSTPEKEIPGGMPKVPSRIGGNKLLWAVVGITAIVGIVAVAGSGGGNGGGNNGGGTGSIEISW